MSIAGSSTIEEVERLAEELEQSFSVAEEEMQDPAALAEELERQFGSPARPDLDDAATRDGTDDVSPSDSNDPFDTHLDGWEKRFRASLHSPRGGGGEGARDDDSHE
jgi:glycogen debranching enzyme